MGYIIGTEVTNDKKIILKICMNQEEFKNLKGNIDNVYIFSSDSETVTANLSQRGKNEATKYFLLPKELRKDLQFIQQEVTCQRINAKDKIFFIYTIDKRFE